MGAQGDQSVSVDVTVSVFTYISCIEMVI